MVLVKDTFCCIAFFFILVFNFMVPSFALAQHEIIESTFCLYIDRPQCSIPCVENTISLSQIQTVENGEKRLYFWTKIRVDEDKNIMHVWSAKGRNDKWAETVHVARSDKLRNLALEVIKQFKDFLCIIYNSNPTLDNVQGVILPVNCSPRFRTYSSIKAKPGEYTVAVYDLSKQLITGGEPKTIKVIP